MMYLQVVDAAVMRTDDLLVGGQVDVTHSVGSNVGGERSGGRGPDLSLS